MLENALENRKENFKKALLLLLKKVAIAKKYLHICSTYILQKYRSLLWARVACHRLEIFATRIAESTSTKKIQSELVRLSAQF